MSNVYVNAKQVPTTSEAVLSTCGPFKTAIVKSLLVCNSNNSSARLLTVILSGSSDFTIFDVKSIASGSTVELLTAPLVLQADEALKISADAATDLAVVASILEIG